MKTGIRIFIAVFAIFTLGACVDGPDNGGGTQASGPPTLVGPPDGSAYNDPRREMWFGPIWHSAPGATAHMLCITKNIRDCPQTPRGVNGSRSTPGFFADMVEADRSVREMPDFCYEGEGNCRWSVAACYEGYYGSWSCEYAEPFRSVRITQ